MNCRGEVVTREATESFLIKSIGTCNDADIRNDANFGLALENEVSVSIVGLSKSTANPKVDYMTLSQKWGISP